jgi:hypothetical protein
MQGIFGGRSFFFKESAAAFEYIAPSVEVVRLQLEGTIADSHNPTIVDGKVQYYEYEEAVVETAVGKDIIVLF